MVGCENLAAVQFSRSCWSLLLLVSTYAGRGWTFPHSVAVLLVLGGHVTGLAGQRKHKQAQAGNLIFGMLELTFETQQGLREISLRNVIKFHAHTHSESTSPNFYKRRELVPRVCTFAAGHFVVLLSWQPLESPVFYLRKRTDPLQKVPMVILVAHVDSVV